MYLDGNQHQGDFGANFTRILESLKKQGDLDPEELKLIGEMRNEGAINTLWLQHHYQQSNREQEVEVIEEFKPISFADYQALFAFAEGAAGIVYKGWQVGTDNLVAIKRLYSHSISSRQRFLRELEFLKKLSHPNILPLLAGGEQDGEYYLVTAYIADGSLEQKLDQMPLRRTLSDIAPFLAVIIQIGKALEYAHSQGIVHRDVKPANILLSGNHPYLADFGLARQIGQDTDLTRGAVGTPCYMAPELWDRKVFVQSDIYSLAVILYEVLSGSYPFSGQTPEQILARQLSTRPRPPVSGDLHLPSRLNDVVLQALDRDHTRRHDSMQKFIAALLQILESL